ncbi:MAG: oligosaccharide flippase family protein [Bacteroidales bacterium]|nr:oligosaccharide flippase family protein [Bacteroidales bacterium]
MGVIQKQSISGVIWSYVGVGLGFLTTAVLFTRFLSTEEIGLLRVLVSYSSVLAMFASLGMNSVTTKIFPQFRDEKAKHQGFLGMSLIIVLAGFLFSSLIYILFKNYFISGIEEDSALFIPYFYAVVPLAFFSVLYGIMDSYYRMLFNAVKGIVFKEVHQRIVVIIALVMYYFSMISFSTFVWLYVLAFALPVLLFVITLIREKKFHIVPKFNFIDLGLRKSMISVALFGILASFSARLVQTIDVIMVNEYLGLSLTGVYTISFFFGTLILIPVRTMAKIGSTVISEAWKSNDVKTISEVYTKSSLTLSIIGLLFFVGIWGNIDNVFQLIGNQYSEGKYVIFFIGLANMAEVVLGLSGQIIVNSKYYRWQTYIMAVFTLIIIVTNIIFIPMYGIMGAALASFISKLIFTVMKYMFIYRQFKMQPFKMGHLWIFLIGGLAWYFSTLIPALPNFYIDIIVRSAAITALFVIPVYYFKISDDLNKRIDMIIKIVRS